MKELMKEKEGQIGGIIGDLHAKLLLNQLGSALAVLP